jgi:hypothetical protein
MVSARGVRGWMGASVVEVTAAIERDEVSEERMARPVSRPSEAAPPRSFEDAPARAFERSAVVASVAARLEATGMEPSMARTLASHPTLKQRGAGTQAIRRTLAEQLDEVETIGPLVSVLKESGIPISYFGFGQNVPDDPQRATPPVLADWVLGEAPLGAHA